MKSLVDISTELANLADYVGGDHLTNKEIESRLNSISKDLFNTAYEIRKITDPKPIAETTGIPDRVYKVLQLEENIGKNDTREVEE